MRLWIKALAVMVVLSAAGATFAQLFGDAAARVNGETISLSEVKAVLDARPSPVPLTKDQERAVKKAALDMLIDDMLMRQFLRRNVPAPSTQEVEKVVDELREALKKQNKTLDGFLKEEKQPEASLRADIVTDLQWKSFLGARYSEQDTKTYFDTYKPFFDKVQVKASHILVKCAATATQAERDNLKARLDNLRTMIKNGELKFDEAARKYSDCPSKDRGGDLGYVTQKFMVVEPFSRAAFSTPVGDISGVFTSEFGLHILKVMDRTAPDPADFIVMKDIVRKTMAQEQNVFRDLLDQQRKSAKIDILMQ